MQRRLPSDDTNPLNYLTAQEASAALKLVSDSLPTDRQQISNLKSETSKLQAGVAHKESWMRKCESRIIQLVKDGR